MPRGVPKSGFRKTRNRMVEAALHVQLPVVQETDEEIAARISERFEVLGLMAEAAVDGDVKALIISGPAGLGKSFTVEKALTNWDPSELNHRVVKGYIKTTGLFKLLYQYRAKGQVLVFDDADDVFNDETSINLLKAALDSSDKRIISYLSEGSFIDEDTGERLPKSFWYQGTIIFLTNKDFDAMIDRGSKLAPHLQALISRAHYVDLTMKSKRDYMVRIRQVVADGLLKNIGLNKTEQTAVVEFIETNHDRLRELSLRMALKLGDICRRHGLDKWQRVARVTTCR